MSIEIYHTMGVGLYAFDVHVENNYATIYTLKGEFVIKFPFIRIFIGNSNRCSTNDWTKDYTPTYTSEYDGNTILLEVSTNKYVFISHYIAGFTTASPIKLFFSPIGNELISCPYAICENGEIILPTECVMMYKYDYYENTFNNPYDYYLNNHRITFHKGTQIYWRNIKAIYNRNMKQRETITYMPSYDKHYYPLYIVYCDKPEKIYLTKEDYCKMIEDFGEYHGYKPLKTNVIL